MNKTALQQQADEIVKGFKHSVGIKYERVEESSYPKYILVDETKNATHCAIIFCEGILGELKYIIDQIDNLDAFRKYVNYTEILTELKSEYDNRNSINHVFN